MSDKKSYQKFTYNELKETLKKLNLPTMGNKAELLDRILAHDPDGPYLSRDRGDIGEETYIPGSSGEKTRDNLQNNDNAERYCRQEGISNINYSYELELLRREKLLMQREIDIMRQENELLRATPTSMHEIARSQRSSVNIKMVSELLNEYSGVDQDFTKWEAQLQLLKDAYELDDNLIKVLIGSQLREKALIKMNLRRQFEKRIWQPGETFHDYYHEKIIKANRVPIPEGHSKMTGDKSEVKIKDSKVLIKEDGRSKDRRYYNCNQLGHLANECKRARREKGSCYSCGEFGHTIKDCTKKVTMPEKKEISNIEIVPQDNDFRRDVTYEISYPNINYVLCLNILFDTRSPVSFIREQFVKHYDISGIRHLQNNLCDFNRSKLIIKVRKTNVTLLVVSDDTMSSCVLLGRDVLKLFQLRLCYYEYRFYCSDNNIMNVCSDNNIMNVCRINEHLPAWVKAELSQLFNNHYVSPNRPDTPNVKAELKLTDNHPLPLIEDQLVILANKKYFSKLDLKNGFFHINMASESIKYTAFVTPLGHFEFFKMSFGLKVGPSRFQRFISDVFKDLIEARDVAIYLDDILMELRLDKCEFLATKIEYLGYAVTKDGVSPTTNGVSAVEKFPISRNVKEVQSFLGLSSYFWKFTLAIIYALRRFRIYLYGIKFRIITDCESLKLTLNKKDINPRIARWVLELQNYDYEVVHRAGSQMQHVDALSRLTNIMVIEDNPLEFNLSVCQNEDPIIRDLKIYLEKSEDRYYEMRNGLVYRKNKNDLLFYVSAFYATKTLSSSETIQCLADYFRNYNRPQKIVSDRADQNIQYLLIATGSPQANGQVERIHRTLTPMLSKLVDFIRSFKLRY
ncbi:hypothetical protein ACFW04_011305 [Cataglyphis niger]